MKSMIKLGIACILVLGVAVASCEGPPSEQAKAPESEPARAPEPAPAKASEPEKDSFKQYGREFKGKIAKSYKDSEEWWPSTPKPPPGTPNVIIFLLDDTGFAHLGSFGGLIETPHIDSLAKDGLRYNNFHTTALCSPSRAAIMAGRNHHRIGLGSHSLTAMGFPGYNAFPPESGKSVAKNMQKAGFVNYATGKWDHTPLYEVSESGPFDRTPSGEGFDHYYGFMAADADNYRSLVWRDHYPTEDWEGRPGYHYSEAYYDYNHYNGLYYTLESPRLGKGETHIKFSLVEDGGTREGIPGGKGELYINGKKVDSVDMPEMHISTFSLSETFDVGIDAG